MGAPANKALDKVLGAGRGGKGGSGGGVAAWRARERGCDAEAVDGGQWVACGHGGGAACGTPSALCGEIVQSAAEGFIVRETGGRDGVLPGTSRESRASGVWCTSPIIIIDRPPLRLSAGE